MKLIVGLGNPGMEYRNTRHNVGFMVINQLLKKYDLHLHEVGNYRYVKTNIDGETVYFMEPLTFMNLSGIAVREMASYYKIPVDDILIIHDDLDLPLGTYRIKQKGSSGGHNGLKSIEENLHTQEYKRIKIGISNNKNIDTKDYVLGKFSKEEQEVLEKEILEVVEIVEYYLREPFSKVMEKYNHK